MHQGTPWTEFPDAFPAPSCSAISGTPYGQWYYVSTERGHSGDWYFPTFDGRLKVTLPSDQPFGADRIVVQDSAGTVVGFAPIVVTP